MLISWTVSWREPSPTKRTVRRLEEESATASAAPWVAPTEYPMDPQRTWEMAVTPAGNLVSQIPKLAVPVSVTVRKVRQVVGKGGRDLNGVYLLTISFSFKNWPTRFQSHSWVMVSELSSL